MDNLFPFFKSLIDQDDAAVVICGIDHTVIYMNPAAVKNYAKWGGGAIVGQSIFDCHSAASCQKLRQVIDWFAASPDHNKVHTFYNEKQQKDVYMIALRDETGALLGYYEKHEFRRQDMSPFYEMK